MIWHRVQAMAHSLSWEYVDHEGGSGGEGAECGEGRIPPSAGDAAATDVAIGGVKVVRVANEERGESEAAGSGKSGRDGRLFHQSVEGDDRIHQSKILIFG